MNFALQGSQISFSLPSGRSTGRKSEKGKQATSEKSDPSILKAEIQRSVNETDELHLNLIDTISNQSCRPLPDVVHTEGTAAMTVKRRHQTNVTDWLTTHLVGPSGESEPSDISLSEDVSVSRRARKLVGELANQPIGIGWNAAMDSLDLNFSNEEENDEDHYQIPTKLEASMELFEPDNNLLIPSEELTGKETEGQKIASPSKLNEAAEIIQAFWRFHRGTKFVADAAHQRLHFERQRMHAQDSRQESGGMPITAAMVRRKELTERRRMQKYHKSTERMKAKKQEFAVVRSSTVEEDTPCLSGLSTEIGTTDNESPEKKSANLNSSQYSLLEDNYQNNLECECEEENIDYSEHDTIKGNYSEHGVDRCEDGDVADCGETNGQLETSDMYESHVDRILKELHDLDKDQDIKASGSTHNDSRMHPSSGRTGGWSDMLSEIHRVLSEHDEDDSTAKSTRHDQINLRLTKRSPRPYNQLNEVCTGISHERPSTSNSHDRTVSGQVSKRTTKRQLQRTADELVLHSLERFEGFTNSGKQKGDQNISNHKLLPYRDSPNGLQKKLSTNNSSPRLTQLSELRGPEKSLRGPCRVKNDRYTGSNQCLHRFNTSTSVDATVSSTRPVSQCLAGVTDEPSIPNDSDLTIQSLGMQLEQRNRSIHRLQQIIADQRELSLRQLKETQTEAEQRLASLKTDYEAAICRQYKMVDQLIEQKKALHSKCEGLLNEVKSISQKAEERLRVVEDRHKVALRKAEAKHAAGEKLRRERWEIEKTRHLKEATVRGMEAEISQLIADHRNEMQQLRQSCAEEIQAADARAYQAYTKLIEELRKNLLAEKEESCNREREAANSRLASILQEEREALESQKQKLISDVAREREEFRNSMAKHNEEMESLKQTMETKISAIKECHQHEIQQRLEEIKESYQREIDESKTRNITELSNREVKTKTALEAEYTAKEKTLRDEWKRQKDEQTEAFTLQLEAATSKARREAEDEGASKMRRIREKLTAEISDLEQSERQAMERYSEMKTRLFDTEQEFDTTRVQLTQKESELSEVRTLYEKLNQERQSIVDVVRQEFADRLVSTEEENQVMKRELAEMKARMARVQDQHEQEMSAVRKTNESDLEAVHQKVKDALQRKDEKLAKVRTAYEEDIRKREYDLKKVEERAQHLEELLTQQRKQFLKTNR